MHATIQSIDLAAALKASVAPSSTTHPTLQHALVRTLVDALVIETTDSSTYMRHTLPCTVQEAGEALLRESLLRPIAGAPGEIVLRADGRVTRGRSNFKVPALDVSSWPEQDTVSWQPVPVDPLLLADAIKCVGYAADDATMHTSIRGLHIGKGLVWGSDGVSLSYVALDYAGPCITIPDAQVVRVLGLLKEAATLEIGGIAHGIAGLLRVTCGNQQMSVRLLAAKSPDIRSIAKAACYQRECTAINREVMLAAVRRFLPFASILGESKAKGLPVMVLAMVKGELYLADRAEDNREVITDAVVTRGPDFRAALDPRRLISALGAIDSNVAAIHAPDKGAGPASWMLYADQGDIDAGAHIVVQMSL